MDFRLVPTSRGIRPPTIFLAGKLREKSSIVELVLRLSECNNHLIEWELIFQMR